MSKRREDRPGDAKLPMLPVRDFCVLGRKRDLVNCWLLPILWPTRVRLLDKRLRVHDRRSVANSSRTRTSGRCVLVLQFLGYLSKIYEYDRHALLLRAACNEDAMLYNAPGTHMRLLKIFVEVVIKKMGRLNLMYMYDVKFKYFYITYDFFNEFIVSNILM